MFVLKVKQLMKEKKLTQADIVRLTGLSKSGVSQYLSGKNKPSKKALAKIADALNVSPEQLTDNSRKRITVQEAAELMGKSPQFVRVAMQHNALPIGTAVKISGSKYTYYISPKLFTEYTGIKL
ncbi:MAG: helix-turn-helix transcriptional regulator [Ruminococcus sp.]|nr:helix-turn-helix transcriptional regulator [Ruminococcus sp.]